MLQVSVVVRGAKPWRAPTHRCRGKEPEWYTSHGRGAQRMDRSAIDPAAQTEARGVPGTGMETSQLVLLSTQGAVHRPFTTHHSSIAHGSPYAMDVAGSYSYPT
jgi:hypothetical protein